MNLKILFLFFTLTFNAFQIASGAVDVQKKQSEESIESSEKMERTFFSKNKIKRKLTKKKWKFKLRNLFKWKPLKKTKENQTEEKKVLDPFAFIGGVLGGGSYLLIIFSVLRPELLLLIILGGIFGMIGLRRIRNKPEKRTGEFMAWVGIVGFILLLIVGALALFIDVFDFF